MSGLARHGVSETERRQWRRDSENRAQGVVSLNARILALLDDLAAAEAARETAERETVELRELLRIGAELDNHHNVAHCPYCRPDRDDWIARPARDPGPPWT